MGSQQGARPTYTHPPRLSPLLPFLPPIALFHPRLIWQRRRRRAGVTEGHCSSSNITLVPLFPSLVTLSLYFALTSLSSPQFCLDFNSSPWFPSSPSHRLYNLGDANTLSFLFVVCSLRYYWEFHQDRLGLIYGASFDTSFFFPILHIYWCLIPFNPFHSPYSHLVCVLDLFSLNLSTLTFLKAIRKEERTLNLQTVSFSIRKMCVSRQRVTAE